MPVEGPRKVRENFIDELMKVLVNYRRTSDSSSPGQIVIPDCLRLLPLYLLSIIKLNV